MKRMQGDVRRVVVAVLVLVSTFVGGVVAAPTASQDAADGVAADTQWNPVDPSPSWDGQHSNDTEAGVRPNVTGAAASIDTGPAQSNDITVTQEYRLTPGQTGKIDVQWQFSIPDNVVELSTQLPRNATNPRRSGFAKTTDRYVWKASEQSTRTPTLTFTVAVNETEEVSGPIGTDGRYLFADTGEWALFRRQPGPDLTLRYRGDKPTVRRTDATAGPGVTGDAMVFLGEHEEYTRSAHGQQFRLVVPDAAQLEPSREDVFDTIVDASGTLRVGNRDDQVRMFVAPATVPWGVRGLQLGDGDFYSVADEPVDTADNVWIHEYVHTRQDFETTAATRWVTEASAEYYAGLLTLEQGRIEFADLRQYLSRGTNRRFADAVLSDPTTWTGTGANYYTGALVTGELDRRLRLATNHSGTYQRLFRQFNHQSSPISQTDFLGAVESVGGHRPRTITRQYTETTDKPSLWSQDHHERAFAPLPARFAHSLPPAGNVGFRVESPYHNWTLGDEPLVTGERLLVHVNVTNVGGTEGPYTLVVRLGDETIARRTGALVGGASTIESVETTVDTTGESVLSTGNQHRTITVRDPATAAVTDLTANRTRVVGGGAVQVTATVGNDADRPASRNLTIRRDGDIVQQRTVRLDAGESKRVGTTVTVTPDRSYQFTAGTQSVTVTVLLTPTPTPQPAGVGGESGGGFGLLSVVLAVTALLAVGHRLE